MGTPLISLGTRALQANLVALQTTGHNIANANVAGYSRQSAEFAAGIAQHTMAGYVGSGVQVASISRAHGEFVTRQADGAASLAAGEAQRLEQLSQLQALLPLGEQGLGASAGRLLNAMVDVANRPADLAARQVVLARAGETASRFAQTGAGLDDLQTGVRTSFMAQVQEANELAAGIATANRRIAQLRGAGAEPNDLLDERDRLINRLAQRMSLTRIDADDGSVSVFVAGGQQLVLGEQAQALRAMADPADPLRVALAIEQADGPRRLAPSALGAGSLAGLLQFQNEDLVAARNQVGQMALALGQAINERQAAGLSLVPPAGTVAGEPLFTWGAPRVVGQLGNAAPIGAVSLSVVQASALEASDYRLQTDPGAAGQYRLTRLRDGLVRSINAGDVVDGLQFNVTPSTLAASDRFELQAVGRAAHSMALGFSDPRGLAAASPLVAAASPANTGTARVASISVLSLPLPFPGATATVSFTDNLGNYSYTVQDSLGATLASGTGLWVAGQSLPPAPASINGASLELQGTPRMGDGFTLAPTPAGAVAYNNGNVHSLLALRERALVNGQGLTEAYSRILADMGVRVQSAQTASQIANAAAQQAEQARDMQSGVNLDEEAARLIQFQQSYQASAKLLQVAQTVFDSLLEATRR